MQTKKPFHIGDVLSITTGRLVSPRHIDGVYDILNFMTDDNLFTHQLPRACDECKPFLLKQFPQLASPEMDFAVAELGEMLKTPSGKAETNKLLLGWLSKITSGKYGLQGLSLCGEQHDMLEVAKVPTDAHEQIDPMSELAEKVHPDKIVVVQL